jgi:hypothetical protein
MDPSSAVCEFRNNPFIQRVDPTTPKMNVKLSVAPLVLLLRVALHRLSKCDVRGILVARDVLSTLALAFLIYPAMSVNAHKEYIDIIAYILMMNGYSAGARALPLDPAVLDSITIKTHRP